MESITNYQEVVSGTHTDLINVQSQTDYDYVPFLTAVIWSIDRPRY
jgi:ribosomal 30S subunit maturation factor RimM